MSFPNHPEKQKIPSLYTAADIVAYRRQVNRMPRVRAPHGILFCLERGLPQRLRWRVPIRRVGSMNGDLYETKRTKNEIGIMTGFGGGSPIVVELAEEFVVMGAKKMILMTWAGALQQDLKAGDIVVCNRAVRDDGASHHYLPPERYVEADERLAEQLAGAIRARGGQCTTGATWTTDAPYRETLEEVKQYQAEGVKTVEMESSGLFTIGQVRGIQTVSVVVVMDSLAHYRWQVPERLDNIQKSLETIYRASIDVLDQP